MGWLPQLWFPLLTVLPHSHPFAIVVVVTAAAALVFLLSHFPLAVLVAISPSSAAAIALACACGLPVVVFARRAMFARFAKATTSLILILAATATAIGSEFRGRASAVKHISFRCFAARWLARMSCLIFPWPGVGLLGIVLARCSAASVVLSVPCFKLEHAGLHFLLSGCLIGA